MTWTPEARRASHEAHRARRDREFDLKHRIEGECWVWTGARQRRHPRFAIGGYGVLRRAGRYLYAHRVAFECAYGPIPSGLIVMHVCDNPPCVRPEHLRLGTKAENTADMVAKDRVGRGILTVDQVDVVRESNAPDAELAGEFHVSVQTIQRARTPQYRPRVA